MRNHFHFRLLALLFGMILLAIACKKDKETDGLIQLQFSYHVGGEELVWEDMRYQAAAGHPFSVVRMRYYISNIELITEHGKSFPVDDAFYVDATMPSKNVIDLGQFPTGMYKSISFVFGLDEVLNVDGGLPNTLENINMEWPLPGDQGYHYMKFEGRYDNYGTGEIKNYNLHTGATGGNQNHINFEMELPDVAVDDNSWTIELIMDINEWLVNPHTYDFDVFGSMIMANQEAQVVLRENGQNVFSVGAVTLN